MENPAFWFAKSQFLGPQLRAARERVGLNQTQLARLLGLDPAMISRWEFIYSTRYVPVPARHWEALAFHLNMTVEELVVSPPDPPPPPPPEPPMLATPAPSFTPPTPIPPPLRFPEPEARSPVPGRPQQLIDGTFRVRLRCPWCRFLNSETAAQPSALPTHCSNCGARMRALVTVTIRRRD